MVRKTRLDRHRYPIDTHVHLLWISALIGVSVGQGLFIAFARLAFNPGWLVQLALGIGGGYLCFRAVMQHAKAICPVCRAEADNGGGNPFHYECVDCGYSETLLGKPSGRVRVVRERIHARPSTRPRRRY